MMWLLLSLIGLLLVALMGMGLFYGERMRQARIEEKAEHAKCMALVTSVVSDRFLAQCLREMADKYDSVEELSGLREVAATYTEAGPSMPALWMLRQAALLDPPIDFNEVAEYNMAGDKVL